MSFVLASGKGLDLTEAQALNGGSVAESPDYVVENRFCADCHQPIVQWRAIVRRIPHWGRLYRCARCRSSWHRASTGRGVSAHQ